MNGLVACSRMGREIRLTKRQCRSNFREATERQEWGWPLFSWASCLVCQAVGRESEAHPAILGESAAHPAIVGAAATKSRPGRVKPAPTTANRPAGRKAMPQPQPQAPAPLCRLCGDRAYAKSRLCFDHLLAETFLKVEQSRTEQRRSVAKKRG